MFEAMLMEAVAVHSLLNKENSLRYHQCCLPTPVGHFAALTCACGTGSGRAGSGSAVSRRRVLPEIGHN
jgi:hypothetical protein